MTALKILIQVISDIYRNPKFLFLVVIPVYLVIRAIIAFLSIPVHDPIFDTQPAEGLLIFFVFLSLLVWAFLVISTAIGWHRLVLAPNRFPTLRSAMINQPRCRYLARTAPLFFISILLGTLITEPVNWFLEHQAGAAKSSNLDTVVWISSEYGPTLLYPILWTLLGLGLPSIALGQKDRWLMSAKRGLNNSGVLIQSLTPVWGSSIVVIWVLDAVHAYPAFNSFAGSLMIEALKGAWSGLTALVLLGLITRFYEQLVQPQTSGT